MSQAIKSLVEPAWPALPLPAARPIAGRWPRTILAIVGTLLLWPGWTMDDWSEAFAEVETRRAPISVTVEQPATAAAASLRVLLAAGRSPAVEIGAPAFAMLARFYVSRGGQPLWVGPAGLEPAGRALLGRLGAIAANGEPSIAPLVRAAEAKRAASVPDELAKLELLLSAGLAGTAVDPRIRHLRPTHRRPFECGGRGEPVGLLAPSSADRSGVLAVARGGSGLSGDCRPGRLARGCEWANAAPRGPRRAGRSAARTASRYRRSARSRQHAGAVRRGPGGSRPSLPGPAWSGQRRRRGQEDARRLERSGRAPACHDGRQSEAAPAGRPGMGRPVPRGQYRRGHLSGGRERTAIVRAPGHRRASGLADAQNSTAASIVWNSIRTGSSRSASPGSS